MKKKTNLLIAFLILFSLHGSVLANDLTLAEDNTTIAQTMDDEVESEEISGDDTTESDEEVTTEL